jgi:PncC family amidohydrolase
MASKMKDLEVLLYEHFTGLGLSFAVAESCSGGLISHRLTNVPGASHYFRGGVVAYSNEAKMDLLGVEEAALASHGAVSEVVAGLMALGARDRFHTDWGLAVTGIAGPTGGTKEKPLGLVFIATAGPTRASARRHVFTGTREAIKTQTAEAAIQLLLEQST